jgi:hypothetical protein
MDEDSMAAYGWSETGAVVVTVAASREVLAGDCAIMALPRERGHALAGTCVDGPSWAAGKRALPL